MLALERDIKPYQKRGTFRTIQMLPTLLLIIKTPYLFKFAKLKGLHKMLSKVISRGLIHTSCNKDQP